jgi:hypothetical protein
MIKIHNWKYTPPVGYAPPSDWRAPGVNPDGSTYKVLSPAQVAAEVSEAEAQYGEGGGIKINNVEYKVRETPGERAEQEHSNWRYLKKHNLVDNTGHIIINGVVYQSPAPQAAAAAKRKAGAADTTTSGHADVATAVGGSSSSIPTWLKTAGKVALGVGALGAGALAAHAAHNYFDTRDLRATPRGLQLLLELERARADYREAQKMYRAGRWSEAIVNPIVGPQATNWGERYSETVSDLRDIEKRIREFRDVGGKSSGAWDTIKAVGKVALPVAAGLGALSAASYGVDEYNRRQQQQWRIADNNMRAEWRKQREDEQRGAQEAWDERVLAAQAATAAHRERMAAGSRKHENKMAKIRAAADGAETEQLHQRLANLATLSQLPLAQFS